MAHTPTTPPSPPRLRRLVPVAALVAALLLIPATGALPAGSTSPADAIGAASEALGVGGPPWAGWAATTVDDDGVFGPTSIAMTSEDRPVIAYTEARGSGHVSARLAWATLTGWEHLEVSNPHAHGEGLAIDAEDQAHVVSHVDNVTDGTRDDLRYVHGSPDGGFEVEYVATDVDFFSASVALTQDDEPRITRGARGLYFYEPASSGSGWVETKVDDGGFHHDLVLDEDDDPHIVYKKPAEGKTKDLWYAVREDGTWQTERVMDGCGGANGLALGSAGHPHIVCQSTDGLVHAWKDGTGDGWRTEVVDQGDGGLVDRVDQNVGADPSIVFDGEGRPHVAYRYEPNFASPRVAPGQPHYAVQVDGEWYISTIDEDGQHNGLGGDIALDGEGRPHVSYVRNERWEGGGGHPGSGMTTQSLFDLRYARPLEAAALGPAGR